MNKWINLSAFHLNLSLPFYERVIKQKRPDVVHAHFGYDGYKLLGLCKKYDIPLLISFYGSDVSRLPDELFWKTRYQRMAKSRARFIAASEFMKSQLIDLGFPSSKIDVVRFGLDLSKLSVKKSAASPQNWMMAGRLVEKKGFDIALQAAKRVTDVNNNYKLTIFGDGPQMQQLKELRKNLGLINHVDFSGFQPIEKIMEAHNSHGLFIAPSHTAKDGDMEGLPNTILESMARGTPVVSTRHAAIPEVIEHGKTGFLTEERNIKQLAAILSEILNGHFNLNSIQSNARKTIENLHDVDTMVNNIENIYDQVCNL